MSWKPENEDDKKAIETLMSMCIDTLGGNGANTRSTFISNLKLYAEHMEDNSENSNN